MRLFAVLSFLIALAFVVLVPLPSVRAQENGDGSSSAQLPLPLPAKPALPKLDSILNAMVVEVELGQLTPQVAAEQRGPVYQDDAVAVTVRVDGEVAALVNFLT